jgi:hypothetical protein
LKDQSIIHASVQEGFKAGVKLGTDKTIEVFSKHLDPNTIQRLTKIFKEETEKALTNMKR